MLLLASLPRIQQPLAHHHGCINVERGIARLQACALMPAAPIVRQRRGSSSSALYIAPAGQRITSRVPYLQLLPSDRRQPLAHTAAASAPRRRLPSALLSTLNASPAALLN